MKKILLVLAMASGLMAACNTDKIRSFIPGTYINNARSEYSIANDTLVIDPSESDSFVIHRKTGFDEVRDKKVGKREYETEQWNALYDPATQTLTETRKGKLITFYPKDSKLMVGKREYEKIN